MLPVVARLQEDRFMAGRGERRRHKRLACGEATKVRVLSSTQDLSTEGKTMASDADDISAGGLCLRVDRPMPVGRGLDLWIRLEGRSGTFMLSGMVKWVTEDPRGGYQVGIQLLEEPTEDLQSWSELLQGDLQYRER
jgi:hypothetical protein